MHILRWRTLWMRCKVPKYWLNELVVRWNGHETCSQRTGCCIRRLADAVEPTEVSADLYSKAQDPENASICLNNLSELHLLLGNVWKSVNTARRAVKLADESGILLCRMGGRASRGDALHQAGDLKEATDQFEFAEQIQAQNDAEKPFLYGQPLFQYCDLLLDESRPEAVIHKTRRAMSCSRTLLFIALDHRSR